MDLLRQLTKKNLLLNKKRTIVTIIGIMLSVALITAVSSMYASGIKSLTNYEKRINGNYHVSISDVNKEELTRIENNRSIKEIYKVKELGYAKIDSKNEYKPYARILGMNNDSMNNLSINLIDGRLPSNSNEVLITTHLKTNGRLDYKIGDTIKLNVGNRYYDGSILNGSQPFIEDEKLIDTKDFEYKVVGIIERPSKGIESYDSAGYSFITYYDFNEFEGSINVYAKYTKNGLNHFIEVTSDLMGLDKNALDIFMGYKDINNQDEYNEAYKKLGENVNSVDFNIFLIELEKNPIKNNSVGNLYKVIVIVCLIIVVTSVFCIKNSFDISITEKVKQYGMLRSIGATKKQIRKNVFYEATLIGFIGIILGILLGLIASLLLVIICNYYFNTLDVGSLKLVFSFNIYAIVVAVVLGIVTIYLSAIKSAYKAAKVSPIESIRNSAEIKIKGNKVKSPKVVSKIFGIGGEISYKNLKRNRKKYRTTIISLIISTSIFIALSYFMSLAMYVVKEEAINKDYNVSLTCNGDNYEECIKKAKQTIKFDNINKYTILQWSTLTLKEHKVNKEVEEEFNETYTYYDEELDKEITQSGYDNLTVYAVGEEEYRRYLKELNLDYEDAKDKGILIDTIRVEDYTSDSIKKKRIKVYDYQKGDKIKYDIQLKDKKKSGNIELIKTTDLAPFGLKELLENPNSSMLIISDSKYIELYEEEEINKIIYDSSDADKLQDAIEKHLDTYEFNLQNVDESVRQLKNLFTLIGIFLYGFITVITLIGVTNIFNTITTSIYLRKREFATLKSIGMTTKEFNRMIRLESIFMGIKSLVFSIPIGIILSLIIFKGLGKPIGATYMIPILPIIIAVIAVFLLISIIMKYSISKVNKQNIIETIRNENI